MPLLSSNRAAAPLPPLTRVIECVTRREPIYASVHGFDRLDLCYGPRHGRRVQSGHQVEFSALIVELPHTQ